jgi:hypothetical protein
LLAQFRYQFKQSALATLADVFTFMPHKICFTATSILLAQTSVVTRLE